MTINIVQKYNGRSLYSMKKLREVAAHIASLRGQYENMVIVVGNMGQSTGDLIAMAKEAGQDIPNSSRHRFWLSLSATWEWKQSP